METCDILIVGGGPAGSSCAWKLRRADLDVVVLDKARFPRDKVCAGWITPAVTAVLQLEPEDYRRGRVFQPITGFRVERMGDRPAELRYDGPVSYGIRRCEFDRYLVERSGARLRLGEPLRALRRTGNEWVVNDSIRTRMLVGAGGHFCPVARHLGATGGRGGPVVAARGIEFEMTGEEQASCGVEADTPELFFSSDLKGYGWAFRKDTVLNIGLGRLEASGLSSHVAQFVEHLRARGRISLGSARKFNGHAYLLYGEATRPTVGDGALLIGDAAGLAYATSGEGIRPAVESGLLAADTIIAAKGAFDRERLMAYDAALRERFGDSHRHPQLDISHMIPQRLKCWLAGKLMARRGFSRHFVMDRWFLHRHEPPLAS